MKNSILAASLLLIQPTLAQTNPGTMPLPDSLRSTAVLVQVQVPQPGHRREASADVSSGPVTLKLETEKGQRKVEFEFPAGSQVVSKNVHAETDEEDISLDDAWQYGEPTLLMIATAADSAAGFTLYSGYVKQANKAWQLVGTCRVASWQKQLTELSLTTDAPKRKPLAAQWQQAWSQRPNGTWKSLLQDTAKAPTINWTGHADSLAQAAADDSLIKQARQTPTWSRLQATQGIYYEITEPGNGGPVALNHRVTVHYKGYLFTNGEVFDQTRDKPASFPLRGLIKGWQVALPLVQVGGKIKVVIPSGQAYSIRTRAAKIPPNSILVFEIEVLESKPAQ